MVEGGRWEACASRVRGRGVAVGGGVRAAEGIGGEDVVAEMSEQGPRVRKGVGGKRDSQCRR